MGNSWWKNFYDENFGSIFLTGEAIPQGTIDFLISELKIGPNSIVFDQCCGKGQTAHAIAERGVYVIGVDQSCAYIEEAQKIISSCVFHVGDAFEFVSPEPCDASINWWTSFGFLEDDIKNTQMLRRAYDSLKPGARFAIEYSSAQYDIRRGQNDIEYRKMIDGGELIVNRRSYLDLKRGMRLSEWNYRYPDGRTEKKEGETRLYTPDDMQILLLKAGFKNLSLYADVLRNPFTSESPRFICVAEKPLHDE